MVSTRWFLVLGALAAMSGGCLERDLQPLNPCLVSGVARELEVSTIDNVDLLFVVDNSNSMAEEQSALRQQFPKLIRTLTSGERNDGTKFPAVKSLHLGVVSTDMGLVGIPNRYGCDPNGGDDGVLQHMGGAPGCKASYPSFLTFELGSSSPDDVANDFACIATLGTGGCGFEQPLEAGLKALWPKQFVDKDGNVYVDNPISFLSTTPQGTFGHGDVSMTQGGNAGFLRTSARDGLSLIAVVVVSDEEVCSSINTSHFTSDPSNPISREPPNLRCFNHKENLFKIQRYIDGFKALRPGKDLVIFAAIVGVPVDLVNAEQRARFNDLKDDDSRNAFYEAMLSDPRMQERPNGKPGINDANLLPSCQGEMANGKPADAYPPIRIVEVARGFGRNGVVQSICQKDFGPAMDAIIRAITDAIPSVCLPKPLVRNSAGIVPCNVVWELPPADKAGTNVPTTCEGPGTYLEPVDSNRPAKNDRGGNNCKVKQLPIGADHAIPEGKGWYYDDFGDDLSRVCAGKPQRVSFTESAKPANGVIVKLECVNETQTLRSTDTKRLPDQPNIGSPCRDLVDASGAAIAAEQACVVHLRDGSEDRSLFCHGELNVCMRECQSTSQCPPAWVCDTRAESLSQSGGRGFCVNPTCGSE